MAIPLSILFGPEALRFRLEDSGAKVVVTAPESLEEVVEACTALDTRIVVVGESRAYPTSWWSTASTPRSCHPPP